MDTRDILTIVAAVVLVAVLALGVPILTGRDSGSTQESGTQEIVWDTGRATPPPTTAAAAGTTVPRTTASPTPRSWNGTPISVGFDTVTIVPTTPPPLDTVNRTLVTYATISGTGSGTTKTFAVPFPYWQMEYTATPSALPPDVFPRIIIQVFDAGEPDRVVGIVNQDVYTLTRERPWVENFYEGNRSYRFQITTRFIDSYTINIKVPVAYA